MTEIDPYLRTYFMVPSNMSNMARIKPAKNLILSQFLIPDLKKKNVCKNIFELDDSSDYVVHA